MGDNSNNAASPAQQSLMRRLRSDYDYGLIDHLELRGSCATAHPHGTLDVEWVASGVAKRASGDAWAATVCRGKPSQQDLDAITVVYRDQTPTTPQRSAHMSRQPPQPTRDLTEAYLAVRRCHARQRSRASLDSASDGLRRTQRSHLLQRPQPFSPSSSSSSSSSSSWLLRPLELLVGVAVEHQPRCSACGVLPLPPSALRRCAICRGQFCEACTRPVPGGVRVGEESACCQRCAAVAQGAASAQLWAQQVAAALGANALVPLYEGVRALMADAAKKQAHYEYLASSIVDPAFAPSRKTEAARSILDAAGEQQERVVEALRRLDEAVRRLAAAAAQPGVSATERIVAANVRAAVANLTAQIAPEFRQKSDKVKQQEVSVATSVYTMLLRLRLEAQDNSRFEEMFGRDLSELLKTARRDLNAVVMSAGLDWDAHMAQVKERVAKWDSTSKPLISNANPLAARATAPAGSEAPFLRKCLSVLSSCLKELECAISSEKLRTTKDAIAILSDKVQLQYSV
eukprot:m51a1_g256 hypothetical protein (516) ;mRNA; f:202797-211485